MACPVHNHSNRPTQAQGCPVASRRQVLFGLGAAGGAIASATGATAAETAENAQVADAPSGHLEDTLQSVPFHGRHQAGIVTPRPANGLVASFDTVVQSRDEMERMFRRLTERIAFLTSGGDVPERDPKLPPLDSGILGPSIAPDNLTVTVGLGASFFDKVGLESLRPKTLQRMTEFPNDALDPELCHGDVVLQFCANTQDTNIHALRDILKNLSGSLVLRWMQDGDVPVIPPGPDGRAESARNYLGFRDGSANPDSNDADRMDEIVWAGAGEPAWAEGGTYMAVRIIRNFVERWDRTPLGEQEAVFGRIKDSGAPFGGTHEYDDFDYANDPDGALTPLDAHIRLANPRIPATEENIILRRPFNYANGATRANQLDHGLLFIVFQADLEKGFIAVQNRLNGEPLEEYIKPVGGGYFFVLPGARDAGDYLGRTLVEAVS